MVDINDNDYKLLKMNESLLSKLSSDDIKFKETIDTYKELAIKNAIDSLVEDTKTETNLEINIPLINNLTFNDVLLYIKSNIFAPLSLKIFCYNRPKILIKGRK